MRITTHQRGFQAEQQACDYLQAHGLILMDRNYRCRFGELDLIMREDNTVVFIEVRSRRTSRYYGTASESITMTKQRRLIRSAADYLQTHSVDCPCRFDVVAITLLKNQPSTHLEWVKNAFFADESFLSITG